VAAYFFGYGMVLSNGCGSRALVLLGRGNLRSLVVVIVLGIAAQMTLKGPDRTGAGGAAAGVADHAGEHFRCPRWCRPLASARPSRARWPPRCCPAR